MVLTFYQSDDPHRSDAREDRSYRRVLGMTDGELANILRKYCKKAKIKATGEVNRSMFLVGEILPSSKLIFLQQRV